MECFFSCLRDKLGKDFITKKVQQQWRKISIEYHKRLDPDLAYYYFTANHDRFYEGYRPDFGEKGSCNCKTKRASKRERLAFVSGRADIPINKEMSTRVKFHNKPVDLPPLSCSDIHITDHSYST